MNTRYDELVGQLYQFSDACYGGRVPARRILATALFDAAEAILAFFAVLLGIATLALSVNTVVALHELQQTMDQTADFLSDLHAERAKP